MAPGLDLLMQQHELVSDAFPPAVQQAGLNYSARRAQGRGQDQHRGQASCACNSPLRPSSMSTALANMRLWKARCNDHLIN